MKPSAPARRIGISADNGGYQLKEYLVGMLCGAGYDATSVGNATASELVQTFLTARFGGAECLAKIAGLERIK